MSKAKPEKIKAEKSKLPESIALYPESYYKQMKKSAQEPPL
jgi:hypothetical protein